MDASGGNGYYPLPTWTIVSQQNDYIIIRIILEYHYHYYHSEAAGRYPRNRNHAEIVFLFNISLFIILFCFAVFFLFFCCTTCKWEYGAWCVCQVSPDKSEKILAGSIYCPINAYVSGRATILVSVIYTLKVCYLLVGIQCFVVFFIVLPFFNLRCLSGTLI